MAGVSIEAPVRKGANMSIFDLVRANVSARAAAEYYGIKVSRNGMACCPFHPDKHPSMKLDQRFHCFGCQADGDAVNLTAGLFGLGNYEAAVKLMKDFNIDHSENANSSVGMKSKKTRADQKQLKHQQRIIRIEKQIRNWLSFAEDTLLKYQHLLELWKKRYRPTMEDAEWHPLLEEAMQMQAINEYHLDILLNGSDEERLDFFVRKGRR